MLHAVGETGELFYYDRKERVALPVDEAAVVIDDPATTGPELEERLRALGFEDLKLDRDIGAGLYLFSRPVASAVPPLVGVPELVETLAANVGRFVSPVLRRGPIWGYFRPELAVRMVPEVSEREVDSLLLPFGSIPARDRGGMRGVYRVALSTSSAVEALEIANRLAVRDDVLWAQVSIRNHGPGPSNRYEPNDEYFEDGLQWGVDHREDVEMWDPQEDLDVNGPEGWFLETGSSDVIFLVMDSGVQRQSGSPNCFGANPSDHPDLSYTEGFDATDLSPSCGGRPVNHCEGHGTWVAGIVKATQDNGEGISGVAPGVVLASARTFGVDGSDPSPCEFRFDGDWVVSALEWGESLAASGNRRVVTNYSANVFDQAHNEMEDKYFETWQAGMVHFVSAGNNGNNEVDYPAGIPGVNGITNLTYEGSSPSLRASSSYGPGTDFTAPGTMILTTDPVGPAGTCSGSASSVCMDGESDYVYVIGTSHASPMAAGVASTVLSRNPAHSSQAVEWVLRQSALDLGPAGWDGQFGWGLPRMDAAIELADALIFFDGFETGGTECWDSTACSGGN